MDPLSTAVGLAASLVTLLALATNSCESLYNLHRRIKSAPDDIIRLQRDAEALKTLLQELHQSAAEIGDDDISEELRKLWAKQEDSLRQDLEDFQRLADRLVDRLQSTNLLEKHVWTRVRRVLSEDTVQQYHAKFSSHMQLLGLIQDQLQG